MTMLSPDKCPCVHSAFPPVAAFSIHCPSIKAVQDIMFVGIKMAREQKALFFLFSSVCFFMFLYVFVCLYM